GNSGPGASTTDHVSPWVTTVAASTQLRDFESTVTLTSGGDTFQVSGASITAGVTETAPASHRAPGPCRGPHQRCGACHHPQHVCSVERSGAARVRNPAGGVLMAQTVRDVMTSNPATMPSS